MQPSSPVLPLTHSSAGQPTFGQQLASAPYTSGPSTFSTNPQPLASGPAYNITLPILSSAPIGGPGSAVAPPCSSAQVRDIEAASFPPTIGEQLVSEVADDLGMQRARPAQVRSAAQASEPAMLGGIGLMAPKTLGRGYPKSPLWATILLIFISILFPPLSVLVHTGGETGRSLQLGAPLCRLHNLCMSVACALSLSHPHSRCLHPLLSLPPLHCPYPCRHPGDPHQHPLHCTCLAAWRHSCICGHTL
jgi:hypothetical protein